MPPSTLVRCFRPSAARPLAAELDGLRAPLRERRPLKVYPPDPALADRRQKVLGRIPTFLDITYLERGLACAPAVVKLTFSMRTGRYYGTGFLIGPDRVLTNHHNLFEDDGAPATDIHASFDDDGQRNVLTVGADPARPSIGAALGDWAVLHLRDKVDRPALHCSPTPAAVGDFVSIIQHPDGGTKKIALHHNNVTHADADIVHYMTDTAPGSSGSPVFDNQWRVVALHREGGHLQIPGSPRSVFRNEGTPIARVREALAPHGIVI